VALLGVDEVEKNWAASKFTYQTENSGCSSRKIYCMEGVATNGWAGEGYRK
jgi:hypothetical protein